MTSQTYARNRTYDRIMMKQPQPKPCKTCEKMTLMPYCNKCYREQVKK